MKLSLLHHCSRATMILILLAMPVTKSSHTDTNTMKTPNNTATLSETRPWGFYEIITEAPTYKIKRIVVLPGKRLSLQRHKHRAEHWIVIEGSGIATLNDQQIPLHANNTVYVHIGDIHRIENNGDTNLVFIEVQTGTYFGEDDIERLADDFGRIG